MRRLLWVQLALATALLACAASAPGTRPATSVSPGSALRHIRWTLSVGGPSIRGYFDVVHVDSQGRAQPGSLTDRHSDFGAVWRPDGNLFAFSRQVRGREEIFLADRQGDVSSRLTRSRALEYPAAWSPDGHSLLFFRTERLGRRRGPTHLFVRDMLSGQERRLNGPGEVVAAGADWSPRGDLIAFTARRDADASSDIYLLDIQSGQVSSLVRERFDEANPAFSPDGTKVVYVRDRRQLDCTASCAEELLIVDLRTRRSRVIRSSIEDATFMGPKWSPDGRWIAFAFAEMGNLELQVMRVGNWKVTRMVRAGASSISGISWFPRT